MRKTEIMYNTRDGNGKDIVKAVKIKEFPIYQAEYTCTICGQAKTEGCRKKDVVSGKFTDHDVPVQGARLLSHVPAGGLDDRRRGRLYRHARHPDPAMVSGLRFRQPHDRAPDWRRRAPKYAGMGQKKQPGGICSSPGAFSGVWSICINIIQQFCAKNILTNQ